MNPRIPELVAELETLVHGHVENEEALQALKDLCQRQKIPTDPWELADVLRRIEDRLESIPYLERDIKELNDQIRDLEGDFDDREQPAEPVQAAPEPRARPWRELLQAEVDRQRAIGTPTVTTTNEPEQATGNTVMFGTTTRRLDEVPEDWLTVPVGTWLTNTR